VLPGGRVAAHRAAQVIADHLGAATYSRGAVLIIADHLGVASWH